MTKVIPVVMGALGLVPTNLTKKKKKKKLDRFEAMDQGLYTGAIFLDLRKAFDVVNHGPLVTKLQM